MQDKIIKFVEDLKNRRMSMDSLDEAATRQGIETRTRAKRSIFLHLNFIGNKIDPLE